MKIESWRENEGKRIERKKIHTLTHRKSQQNINWFDLFFLMESFLMIKILWIVCKHSIVLEWNILHFVTHSMFGATYTHSTSHFNFDYIGMASCANQWILKIQNCYFISMWIIYMAQIMAERTSIRSLDAFCVVLFLFGHIPHPNFWFNLSINFVKKL